MTSGTHLTAMAEEHHRLNHRETNNNTNAIYEEEGEDDIREDDCITGSLNDDDDNNGSNNGRAIGQNSLDDETNQMNESTYGKGNEEVMSNKETSRY